MTVMTVMMAMGMARGAAALVVVVVVLGQVAVEMWAVFRGRPTRLALVADGAVAGSGGWR
jgi:hypothetical protein